MGISIADNLDALTTVTTTTVTTGLCAATTHSRVTLDLQDTTSSLLLQQQELSFLDKLPYDVIHNIFSRLTQKDCLECMGVSTVWYELVPQYATMLWRKVEISFLEDNNNSESYAYKYHHPLSIRVIRCLGPHVQQVVLSHCGEEQVHSILSTLSLRCNCSPRIIEFYKCVIIDQARFVTILRSMSSQLEELTFDAHNYNMAFLQVMKACPRLTHFSYSVYDYVPPEVYDTEPVVVELSSSTSSLATVKTTTTTEAAVEKMEEDENPLDYSSKDDDDESLNITYLCLNAVLHKDKRAAPILRRCPKLRYLAISNIDIDSDFHMWPSKDSIDLDMFFRLCPLLQCIECNSWDGNQQQQQQRWRQYARDIHYSPRNHQHLLLDNGSSNSPSRRSKDKGSINDFTEEGGLRELITSGAEGYGADQIIPILKRNKSTLQILDLGEGISARGDSWDASSDWSQLEHITHLQRLHTFSYKYLSLNDRVLCGFLRQCPVLTDLTLWCKMTIIPDELLLVINNKLPLLTRLDLGFTSTLAVPSETTWRWFFTNNNGRLKRLCLRWNNFISDAVLDAIGTMRQLEELHLRHTAKRATRMDALRRLNHLDRLELWTVDAPLDPVLSDLYWLKELYLVGCKEVSSHGLRALVDTPGCKLKKLRVQSCGSIRPHMMDYIDSKLASLSSSPSHQ